MIIAEGIPTLSISGFNHVHFFLSVPNSYNPSVSKIMAVFIHSFVSKVMAVYFLVVLHSIILQQSFSLIQYTTRTVHSLNGIPSRFILSLRKCGSLKWLQPSFWIIHFITACNDIKFLLNSAGSLFSNASRQSLWYFVLTSQHLPTDVAVPRLKLLSADQFCLFGDDIEQQQHFCYVDMPLLAYDNAEQPVLLRRTSLQRQ